MNYLLHGVIRQYISGWDSSVVITSFPPKPGESAIISVIYTAFNQSNADYSSSAKSVTMTWLVTAVAVSTLERKSKRTGHGAHNGNQAAWRKASKFFSPSIVEFFFTTTNMFENTEDDELGKFFL